MGWFAGYSRKRHHIQISYESEGGRECLADILFAPESSEEEKKPLVLELMLIQ